MTGYGIKRKDALLVWMPNSNGQMIFMPIKLIHRPEYNPVIFSSAYEADEFMQDFTTKTNDYHIVVHMFTENELQEFTFRRLKGY